MKKIRAHVTVSGLVQGVFFRDSVRRRARELGVGGWVRNLADGRVEAIFEGDADRVRQVVDFIRAGPPPARVDAVEVEETPIDEAAPSFAIR